MYDCLIPELSRLKQSSLEAVENVDNFNAFKKYMHIERPFEEKLKTILRDLRGEKRPQLVLVCGSVGDGKSHLISYLKETEPELFENVDIHNDATESFSPSETSIDTLNTEMRRFNDISIQEGLDSQYNHMIVAINLGTLNNFLNSDYHKNYKALYEFVNENNILEEETISEKSLENWPFHFINLSEYHLFELKSGGVDSSLQKNMLSRITKEGNNNPFYRTYELNCQNKCPVKEICPVKKNYELLSREDSQNTIIKQLAELNIKYKSIISPRTYMDFIYHIMVDEKLDFPNKTKIIVDRLKNYNPKDYLYALLPNRFYEYGKDTEIFKDVKHIQPGIKRNEKTDRLLISFFNTENIDKFFYEYIDEDLIQKLDLSSIFKSVEDDLLKKELYVSLLRINKFFPNSSLKEIDDKDWNYETFLKYLYAWNRNDQPNIRSLYKSIERSIYLWNGDAGENKINLFIGANQWKYSVIQFLTVDPVVRNQELIDDETLEQFSTHINLVFEVENTKNQYSIDIDYHLFDLIMKIQEGYRPNAQDKNNFVGFVDFINRIIKDGSQNKVLEFKNKSNSKSEVYQLSLDQFGYYSFKENS
ncbi:DNA phosphorothioation-dependent restriction protein DptF [Marinococcus halophilus]|uniref:DNA phosphorothioation-dependent restriction protein DptF n=1 Tax=Marinococcus halophilus TaxID=1371 RepID=UPI001FD61B01|nr:DNA phosphorothioation-dependent restriction protein DptF [Marinococcus halophilus]